MNYFSQSTVRELAKYLLDTSKLVATGAFITPFFSAKEVAQEILAWMGTIALLLLFAGLLLHRLADHMEGID